jgi:hypothetical protein
MVRDLVAVRPNGTSIAGPPPDGGGARSPSKTQEAPRNMLGRTTALLPCAPDVVVGLDAAVVAPADREDRVSWDVAAMSHRPGPDVVD